MKTTFIYNEKEITLTATYIKSVPQSDIWPKSNNGLFSNEYRIEISTPDNKETFLFYGSHDQYTKGVKQLTEEELMSAFYCFLFDAETGSKSAEEIMGDFGYDIEGAENIQEKCAESLEKYENLFSDDIYDFLNWMQENEYC